MIHKLKVFFAVFFITLAFAHAKNVQFALAPFGSSSVTTTMSFDWSEEYLASSSFNYNHDIARIACALASMTYQDFASNTENNILRDAYLQLGIKQENIHFFYDVDFLDSELGYDQCAFSIAHSDSFMIVNVRGVNTQNTYEWISCLNVSNETQKDSVFHEGFYKPTIELKKEIDKYIKDNNIDCRKIKLVLTGHSRGAAIVNLLASIYAQESTIPTEHIFAYTFGSPNTTTDKSASEAKFGFIWNIVSAEDIVTTVPFNCNDWKYTKYGNTLVLANNWNTDSTIYNEEYIPKINSFFTKIKNRSYRPLETSSFIPSQIAKFITSINKDVESYYSSTISMYKVGKKYLEKNNPYDLMNRDFSKSETFIDKAALLATERSNGIINVSAVIDSHTSETYLSYLMALDKRQAFSSLGSSQIILTGTQSGYVLDKDGNTMLNFSNGRIKYKSMKLPIAAFDSGMNSISIGFPANQEFTIVVAKDSLAPTQIKATLENYDANGVLVHRVENKKLYPYKNKSYAIKTGYDTYANASIQTYPIEETAGFTFANPAYMSIETSFDTNRNIGYGFHYGAPNSFYASFLVSTGILRKEKIFDFAPGIGYGQTISGPFLFDVEALAKCRFSLDDKNASLSERFSLIPSLRTTFSVVPFHRLRIFAAGTIDLNTKNDSHKKIEPALQFGLRF